MKGEGGWTEIKGCPLFTNDQIDLANQQTFDTFIANPNLDAFILIGGWAQSGPQAYAQVTDQVMGKLKEKKLVIVAGDTRERTPGHPRAPWRGVRRVGLLRRALPEVLRGALVAAGVERGLDRLVVDQVDQHRGGAMAHLERAPPDLRVAPAGLEGGHLRGQAAPTASRRSDD